ncbi:MAG: hypothetical protein F4X97_02305 [Boseongicola sp. SB0662_bin_57]|nr:hypothetical protein [Boseongicola sp. SB0662_bin_57]
MPWTFRFDSTGPKGRKGDPGRSFSDVVLADSGTYFRHARFAVGSDPGASGETSGSEGRFIGIFRSSEESVSGGKALKMEARIGRFYTRSGFISHYAYGAWPV